jgi:hypothetical protein
MLSLNLKLGGKLKIWLSLLLVISLAGINVVGLTRSNTPKQKSGRVESGINTISAGHQSLLIEIPCVFEEENDNEEDLQSTTLQADPLVFKQAFHQPHMAFAKTVFLDCYLCPIFIRHCVFRI